MRTATLLSIVLLSSTLPAEAYDLPEHTVLTFNLPACPKGWVEYTPAAGALVAGIGANGVTPSFTIADAASNSAPKSKVAGLLFCERNKNRR